MTGSLGIVIPTYRPNVDTLEAYVRSVAHAVDPDAIRIELDDASPGREDDVRTLERTVSGTELTVNAVDARRGKGAAITAGFEALETDVLAFADDDGSTLAPSLDRVVEAVRTGDADLAAANRYHDDAWVHESRHRNLNGRFVAWTARRMLPVSLGDYQCGAKAIDHDAWTAVRDRLREPGFAWDLELVSMAHLLGYEVRDVPVDWVHDPRSRAESLSTAAEIVRALVTVRHRGKRMHGDPLHKVIGLRTERRRPLIESARPLSSDE